MLPFKVHGVLDDQAGKERDLVGQADGKPLVLIFVHEFNRPSLATIRAVMGYAAPKAKEGKLVAGVVMLTADATATEELLKRAKQALPKDVPITISPDGLEGPGGLRAQSQDDAHGAGREREQGDGQLRADPTQCASRRAKDRRGHRRRVGLKPPTPKELGVDDGTAAARPKAKPGDRQDPNLNRTAGVIRKDASKEDVDAAAEKVVEYLEEEQGGGGPSRPDRQADRGFRQPRKLRHAGGGVHRAWAEKYGGK